MAIDNHLVKKANQEETYSAHQINELMKCMDPETGYLHFAKNYAYIQHPTKGRLRFTPYDYQIGLLESYHKNIRSVAMLPRQTGKALCLDTPIPTKKGWTTMGDIAVGDKILGADGKETTVTFATEVMHNRLCYSVIFDNGERITADAEHLWTVYSGNSSSSQTLTTEEIIELQQDDVDVWIATASSIDCDSTKSPDNAYLEGSRLAHGEFINAADFTRATKEQRLQYLQGLMDTIGFVTEQGVCKLCSTKQQVISIASEILSSLGIKNFFDKHEHTLSFETELNVFRNSEPLNTQICSSHSRRHYIIDIIPVETVPVRCIQVDNDDKLFLCGKSMIPTHNTTCAAIYLTWYAMFVPDQTVLIAAHKFTGAQEIMQRVRYVYEECPDFVRAGATSFNKGSIEFDNGSRIVSATTTETTGRGMSISLLYCLSGDTFVTIKDKQTSSEESITLAELYSKNSDNECESTGCANLPEDSASQHYSKNNDYLILTPGGWEEFDGIIFNKRVNKTSRRLMFEDETSITATDDHRFFVNGIETKVCDLSIGDCLDSKDSKKKITDISCCVLKDTYEIFNAENHVILANGINSHQCDELAYVGTSVADEFISSIMPTLATGGKFIVTSTPNSDEDTFAQIWKAANDKFDENGNEQEFGRNGFYPYFVPWDAHPDRDEQWKKERIAEIGEIRFRREFQCEFIIDEETLISPDVLAELSGDEPLFHTGEVRWYKKPKSNYTYAVALDPSMGTGGDYAAIQVFELPTYEQVAEWRSNTTAIPRQIRILRDICSYIESECRTSNAIYWSIENNAIGEAALIVIDDFGEENIPGLFVSEPVRKGHIRKFRKGFNTTHGTKISACSRLKTLVDNKQLTIRSKPFVSELKTYISSGASYKAKQGTTDDLISATLLAIRMMVVLKDWDPAIYNSFNQAAGMDEDWEPPMPIFVSSGLR